MNFKIGSFYGANFVLVHFIDFIVRLTILFNYFFTFVKPNLTNKDLI
jgi:hypothetical protein